MVRTDLSPVHGDRGTYNAEFGARWWTSSTPGSQSHSSRFSGRPSRPGAARAASPMSGVARTIPSVGGRHPAGRSQRPAPSPRRCFWRCSPNDGRRRRRRGSSEPCTSSATWNWCAQTNPGSTDRRTPMNTYIPVLGRPAVAALHPGRIECRKRRNTARGDGRQTGVPPSWRVSVSRETGVGSGAPPEIRGSRQDKQGNRCEEHHEWQRVPGCVACGFAQQSTSTRNRDLLLRPVPTARDRRIAYRRSPSGSERRRSPRVGVTHRRRPRSRAGATSATHRGPRTP